MIIDSGSDEDDEEDAAELEGRTVSSKGQQVLKYVGKSHKINYTIGVILLN